MTRDLARVRKAVNKMLTDTAMRARRAVSKSLATGQPFEARFILENRLHKNLSRALLISYLQGVRRTQLYTGLKKFDILDDLEKVLERLVNVDNINTLREFFNTKALDLIAVISEKLEKEVRKEFVKLIGLPTRTAQIALGKVYESLGITPSNPRLMERLVRTHSQIAYSAARWESEQSPEVQEILWGYVYNTAGDNRVRKSHALLDGVTLPKEDPFWQKWYPPNGYECRCVAIPVFDERKIKRPPKNLPELDPDFAFNPGHLLRV